MSPADVSSNAREKSIGSQWEHMGVLQMCMCLHTSMYLNWPTSFELLFGLSVWL